MPSSRILVVMMSILVAWGCGTTSKPTPKTPFEVGKEALAAGDYSTAIFQLTLAIENAGPRFFTEAYLQRGECHRLMAGAAVGAPEREQRNQLAMGDFDAVIQNPESDAISQAQALKQKGEILVAMERPREAEETYREILELQLPPAEKQYRIEARLQLGRLLLTEARRSAPLYPSAEEELVLQEKYRRAQEEFSLGLELDAGDPELNLGKGMCLHHRGQYREAMTFLEASTRISESRKAPNPRAYFYLGHSREKQSGLQPVALQDYEKALAQDTTHDFTPIYEHLVMVLPSYLTPGETRFAEVLDAMLLYEGGSEGYWRDMETLAEKLIGASSSATPGETSPADAAAVREQGTFARAMARARQGKTDAAVEDALLLLDTPAFAARLDRIFPASRSRPEYLYGRAKTLLRARSYDTLDAFLQSDAFREAGAVAGADRWYQRALVLQGSCVLDRWISEHGESPGQLTPDAKIERNKKLEKARDAFRAYLELYPDDREIRVALGRVHEIMEAFGSAFLNYAMVARDDSEGAEAFRRIARLHETQALPGSDQTEAWKLLRTYAGKDSEVLEYVRKTQQVIESDALLYCPTCGRKGSPGDTICLECGSRIGEARRSLENRR